MAVAALQSTSIKDLFAAEISAGTGFFSNGRLQVQIGQLSEDEITMILTAYRSNLNRIQKVSQTLYNDLVSQQQPFKSGDWSTNGRNVGLKFAAIAKGTLASQGGTKSIVWPPQVGQIGVAWLDPYLVQYSRAQNSTFPDYTDYTPNTWNIPFNAVNGATLVQLLGSATFTRGTPPATNSTVTAQKYYQASNQTTNGGQRELWFIFQNGVLEVGTTPDIQQWLIQSSLTQAFNAYTTDPLVLQPIEERKLIYQYNTPGVIPVYNDMGIYFAGLAQTTFSVNHTLPLLGLAFYETNLLPAPQWI